MHDIYENEPAAIGRLFEKVTVQIILEGGREQAGHRRVAVELVVEELPYSSTSRYLLPE